MQTTILDAQVEFVEQTMQVPMRLSGGLITEITEARASVTVSVDGHEATGHGAIYLSDVWAWPTPHLTHDERDHYLRTLSINIAHNLAEWCGGEPAHPTELGLRLHDRLLHHIKPPVDAKLARILCASPFDAAIHDAVGIALHRSAFTFYDNTDATPIPLPSADHWFPNGGAAKAIAGTLRPPHIDFDAWHCVSRDDTLEKDIAPWIRDHHYRCLKLKLMGKDPATDVARTIQIYRGVQAMGPSRPRLSVDSNEGNPDAASVLAYLQLLRAEAPDIYHALEYLEQPTSRDILAHPQDWRTVTQLKPVILDEGLTGMELLPEVLAQGWSGIAVKTCKGHSFALVAAAWARANGLLVAQQDLTNPGIAAIHSALLAAHLDTINGIELNSPQYTPQANTPWLPRLASLLDTYNGTQRLPENIPIGLGSCL